MADAVLSLALRALGQARLAEPAVGGRFERGRPLASESIDDPFEVPLPPVEIDVELLVPAELELASSWDGLLGTLLRSRESTLDKASAPAGPGLADDSGAPDAAEEAPSQAASPTSDDDGPSAPAPDGAKTAPVPSGAATATTTTFDAARRGEEARRADREQPTATTATRHFDARGPTASASEPQPAAATVAPPSPATIDARHATESAPTYLPATSHLLDGSRSSETHEQAQHAPELGEPRRSTELAAPQPSAPFHDAGTARSTPPGEEAPRSAGWTDSRRAPARVEEPCSTERVHAQRPQASAAPTPPRATDAKGLGAPALDQHAPHEATSPDAQGLTDRDDPHPQATSHEANDSRTAPAHEHAQRSADGHAPPSASPADAPRSLASGFEENARPPLGATTHDAHDSRRSASSEPAPRSESAHAPGSPTNDAPTPPRATDAKGLGAPALDQHAPHEATSPDAQGLTDRDDPHPQATSHEANDSRTARAREHAQRSTKEHAPPSASPADAPRSLARGFEENARPPLGATTHDAHRSASNEPALRSTERARAQRATASDAHTPLRSTDAEGLGAATPSEYALREATSPDPQGSTSRDDPQPNIASQEADDSRTAPAQRSAEGHGPQPSTTPADARSTESRYAKDARSESRATTHDAHRSASNEPALRSTERARAQRATASDAHTPPRATDAEGLGAATPSEYALREATSPDPQGSTSREHAQPSIRSHEANDSRTARAREHAQRSTKEHAPPSASPADALPTASRYAENAPPQPRATMHDAHDSRRSASSEPAPRSESARAQRPPTNDADTPPCATDAEDSGSPAPNEPALREPTRPDPQGSTSREHAQPSITNHEAKGSRTPPVREHAQPSTEGRDPQPSTTPADALPTASRYAENARPQPRATMHDAHDPRRSASNEPELRSTGRAHRDDPYPRAANPAANGSRTAPAREQAPRSTESARAQRPPTNDADTPPCATDAEGSGAAAPNEPALREPTRPDPQGSTDREHAQPRATSLAADPSRGAAPSEYALRSAATCAPQPPTDRQEPQPHATNHQANGSRTAPAREHAQPSAEGRDPQPSTTPADALPTASRYAENTRPQPRATMHDAHDPRRSASNEPELRSTGRAHRDDPYPRAVNPAANGSRTAPARDQAPRSTETAGAERSAELHARRASETADGPPPTTARDAGNAQSSSPSPHARRAARSTAEQRAMEGFDALRSGESAHEPHSMAVDDAHRSTEPASAHHGTTKHAARGPRGGAASEVAHGSTECANGLRRDEALAAGRSTESANARHATQSSHTLPLRDGALGQGHEPKHDARLTQSRDDRRPMQTRGARALPLPHDARERANGRDDAQRPPRDVAHGLDDKWRREDAQRLPLAAHPRDAAHSHVTPHNHEHAQPLQARDAHGLPLVDDAPQRVHGLRARGDARSSADAWGCEGVGNAEQSDEGLTAETRAVARGEEADVHRYSQRVSDTLAAASLAESPLRATRAERQATEDPALSSGPEARPHAVLGSATASLPAQAAIPSPRSDAAHVSPEPGTHAPDEARPPANAAPSPARDPLRAPPSTQELTMAAPPATPATKLDATSPARERAAAEAARNVTPERDDFVATGARSPLHARGEDGSLVPRREEPSSTPRALPHEAESSRLHAAVGADGRLHAAVRADDRAPLDDSSTSTSTSSAHEALARASHVRALAAPSTDSLTELAAARVQQRSPSPSASKRARESADRAPPPGAPPLRVEVTVRRLVIRPPSPRRAAPRMAPPTVGLGEYLRLRRGR